MRRYDTNGNELWTRQFGPNEEAVAITVNGMGSVWVAGNTFGTFPGQRSAENLDAFVRQYGANGNELWTRQFGTNGDDSASAIAVDGPGNVWVTGTTFRAFPGQRSTGKLDAFIRKYSANGNELWTRQFGSSVRDEHPSIAVDGLGNS